jgi:hypothetical protein
MRDQQHRHSLSDGRTNGSHRTKDVLASAASRGATVGRGKRRCDLGLFDPAMTIWLGALYAAGAAIAPWAAGLSARVGLLHGFTALGVVAAITSVERAVS